jgi:cephalosporin-C deacetylase
MKARVFLSVISALIIFVSLSAQPRRELVKVLVAPDHASWTYEIGERAEFTVTVLRNNVPLEGIEINYIIQPELVEIWDEGTVILTDGEVNSLNQVF